MEKPIGEVGKSIDEYRTSSGVSNCYLMKGEDFRGLYTLLTSGSLWLDGEANEVLRKKLQ
jgi:hypothetical protein